MPTRAEFRTSLSKELQELLTEDFLLGESVLQGNSFYEKYCEIKKNIVVNAIVGKISDKIANSELMDVDYHKKLVMRLISYISGDEGKREIRNQFVEEEGKRFNDETDYGKKDLEMSQQKLIERFKGNIILEAVQKIPEQIRAELSGKAKE